jgi:hypothetical protein
MFHGDPADFAETIKRVRREGLRSADPQARLISPKRPTLGGYDAIRLIEGRLKSDELTAPQKRMVLEILSTYSAGRPETLHDSELPVLRIAQQLGADEPTRQAVNAALSGMDSRGLQPPNLAEAMGYLAWSMRAAYHILWQVKHLSPRQRRESLAILWAVALDQPKDLLSAEKQRRYLIGLTVYQEMDDLSKSQVKSTLERLDRHGMLSPSVPIHAIDLLNTALSDIAAIPERLTLSGRRLEARAAEAMKILQDEARGLDPQHRDAFFKVLDGYNWSRQKSLGSPEPELLKWVRIYKAHGSAYLAAIRALRGMHGRGLGPIDLERALGPPKEWRPSNK